MFGSDSKKRRLYRECGLIFPWRGGSGNTWRNVVALLMTAALTVLLCFAFRIRDESMQYNEMRRGEVLYVSGMSEDLRWWCEQNSPIADAWDRDYEIRGESRVEQSLYQVLNQSAAYETKWQKVELFSQFLESPEVVNTSEWLKAGLSEIVAQPAEESGERENPALSIAIAVEGTEETLRKRIVSQAPAPFDIAKGANLLGADVLFRVILSPSGRVVVADIVEHAERTALSEKQVTALADWLRLQSFSAGKGYQSGVLTLRLRAEGGEQ